ncbi:SRPBCC family protein [Chitinophaga deserti]|uniref:SRPBCC family protein n=1 Tax=Chitinophaga deserti TaxID=2164099 RepID=UPI000D6D30C4|nr:SRPBCC domain-containing protein [Chitinophaga deserti]
MYNIEHIQYVKATADKVFDALTTKAGLAEIWTEKLVVKPEAGFINEFDFNDNYNTRFKVLAMSRPNRIRWECVDSDQEWIGTFLSFDIEQRQKHTAVVLKHSNWRELTEFYRYCNYNWAWFLYSLKLYCETGEGAPFQRRHF